MQHLDAAEGFRIYLRRPLSNGRCWPIMGAINSGSHVTAQLLCRIGLTVAKCDQQHPGASLLTVAARCTINAGCDLRTRPIGAAPAVAAGSKPVAKSGSDAISCAVLRVEGSRPAKCQLGGGNAVQVAGQFLCPGWTAP